MNNTEFHTKDIYLATALKLSGVKIIRVANRDNKGIFVFEDSTELKALAMRFFNGELRVDPQALFETWKTLKSMTYSAVGNVR